MNKPLKRHPFIVEFSKDHHYGLLLVWKIRQGLKKGIAIERIAGYIKLFAEIDTFPHFEEEEKFLLPLLSSNDILTKKLLKEHRELREILKTIFEGQSNSLVIQKFADELEAHIRFEERQFFPHLQNQVDLDAIVWSENKEKHNQNKIDEIWIDNFWENTRTK